MLVKKGIFSNQSIDICRLKEKTIKIEGECFYDGILKIQILDVLKIVDGFDGIIIGSAIHGVFLGAMKTLPPTGTYDMKIWIEDDRGNELEKVQVKKVILTDKGELLTYPNDVQLKPPPIKLDYIKYKLNKSDNQSSEVIIKYKNVIGELTSQEDPLGFNITLAPRFKEYNYVTDIKLKGSKIILYTNIPFRGVNDISLSYVSYDYPQQLKNCITDSMGRLLPAMDLKKIAKLAVITPYINVLKVSPILPLKEPLEQLDYPYELNKSIFVNKYFSGWFLDVTEDFLTFHKERSVMYFCFNINCEEDMKLRIHLGYGDSGFTKVWVNTVPILYNTQSGDYIKSFNSIIGKNEILIALSPTAVKRVGMYVRLERIENPTNFNNNLKHNAILPRLIRSGEN